MSIHPSTLLRYIWAAPATTVGLVLTIIACAFGATIRFKQGVLEVAGGRLARAASLMPPWHLLAITFGHVVIGVSHDVLARERTHEHTHVRQYENWGILFFPLYLASSAVQLLRGGHPYRHNRFECQAFEAASDRTPHRALQQTMEIKKIKKCTFS